MNDEIRMSNDELPIGWVQSKIGNLCSLKNGRAFKPTEWTTSGLPIVRIQNLNNPKSSYNYFAGEPEPRYHLLGGELLFAWSGTPGTSFGAHVWRGGEAVLNQHIFRVDFDAENMDKRFFRFAINQKLDELIDVAHGGVGLRHVTKGTFEGTEIKVPPFSEQKRIADKLEAVLGRVDACRARLDRVPALLKRFRQSVLAAAVSGKLTEEWRKESPEYAETFVEYPYSHTISGPVGWTLTNFGNLCDLIGGSQPPKATFVQQESPSVIRLIQIRDYKSDKHKIFIPRKLARRFCSKTDVMIGRYGPPIFQILRGLEGAYNVALMKAQPKDSRLDLDYLYRWLQQDVLLRYIESGSDRTAGQDGIRKELVESYPFFLPPLPEQQEIVRRVEDLFAFADRIEARLAVAQKTVDRLTPSVLAKAFRGELVPQDPNDEPASSLLERLRSQPATKPTRKTRKPRK